MIIIPKYKLIFNKKKKIFEVVNIAGCVYCPECDKQLKYRDSRKRILRKYGGKKLWVLIRRLKCCNCRRLHTELPDCLAPHKHYEVEVIENVVDEVIDSDDMDEDYPCDATMKRWKKWILDNTSNINAYMKSIGYQVLGLGEELLRSAESILERLQEEGEGWLSIILRTIYNSGYFLPSKIADDTSHDP